MYFQYNPPGTSDIVFGENMTENKPKFYHFLLKFYLKQPIGAHYR